MRAEGYSPPLQADAEELGDASASIGDVSTSPRGLYQESPLPIHVSATVAQEDDQEDLSVVESCALSLASDFSCMRANPAGPASVKTVGWEHMATPSQADEVTSMKLFSSGQRATSSTSAGLFASQEGPSRESSKEHTEQARGICSAIADSQLESTACSSTTRHSPTRQSSKRSMCTTLATRRSAASLCSDGTSFSGGYDDHVVQDLSAVCVPYRIKPEEANVSNLFPLRRYPEVRQDAKLHEILVGARIARSVRPFPEVRSWQNVAWIVPFVFLVSAATASSSVYVCRDINNLKLLACQQIADVLMASVSGMAASFATARCLLSLVRRCPNIAAWSVLVAGPGLTTGCAIGVVVLSTKQEDCGVSPPVIALLGVALIVAHLLPGLFVVLYRKSGVDFTGRLLEVVVSAVLLEQRVLLVPVLVAGLGGAWSLMMCVTLRGLYTDLEGRVHKDNHGIQYAIYGLTILVLLWGLKFLGLASHVAYCGLCGRCYFGNVHRRPLLSFRVPVTTSLGTVCLASFCCSLVGSVELLLRQMSRERQEDEGNSVCCLLWYLAECITSALGDAMEYCNEWALVQVAVRGLDFQDSVRVTARMMICSNMQYATRDLLLDALLLAATLTCSAVAAATGMGLGLVLGILGQRAESPLACAISALLAGVLAGHASMAIVAGGGKTFLALWAEDPHPCRALNSAFHNELHEHIKDMYIRDGSGTALGSSTPRTTETPSSSVAA